MKLILASASPRRRDLIKQIDFLDVECIPSDFDEKSVAYDTPEKYAMTLARGKASDVYKNVQITTLGVDTVVACEGEILGKPGSYNDAIKMLKKLSGKTHTVISGYCLIFPQKIILDYEKTFVTFDEFDISFIKKYADTGSCFDKAGSYGIQDEMIKSVTAKIEGDYFNVVGLPLTAIKKILLENMCYGTN